MSLHRFNQVTFGLPTESFHVNAYVSVAERMPIVTEFVLKVVYTCDGISAASLREFFGFTHAEALAVVESLCRKSLLVLEGETLRLSAYAREQFNISEKHPSFIKIAPTRDRVAFDLLTFFPLPDLPISGDEHSTKGGRSTDGSIKLEVPDELLGQSVERARAAYRQHYDLIAFRREGYRERNFGVYSIEDIESVRRRYVPVNVSFALDEEGQVHREYDEQFGNVAPMDLVKTVSEQITKRMPSTLRLSSDALADFIATFDADFFQSYIRGKGFDLARFVQDIERDGVKTPRGVRAIFGNLYLPENFEGLVPQIRRRLEGKQRKQPLITSVAWLVPDYPLWGRGESFARAVRGIREALRAYEQDLHVCAFAQAEQEWEIREQLYGPALAQLHFIRSGPSIKGHPMDGRLEILLMPAGFVCVLFHLTVPGADGAWAPIGFVSTLPKHREAAQRLLVNALSGPGYGGRAQGTKDARSSAPTSFEQAMPFLLSAQGEDPTDESLDDLGELGLGESKPSP